MSYRQCDLYAQNYDNIVNYVKNTILSKSKSHNKADMAKEITQTAYIRLYDYIERLVKNNEYDEKRMTLTENYIPKRLLRLVSWELDNSTTNNNRKLKFISKDILSDYEDHYLEKVIENPQSVDYVEYNILKDKLDKSIEGKIILYKSQGYTDKEIMQKLNITGRVKYDELNIMSKSLLKNIRNDR